MIKIFKACLIPFAFVATPILAEPVEAPASATIVVHTADLDLRSSQGRRLLDRRLARAVVDVCGAASMVDLAGANAVSRCVELTGKRVAGLRNERIAGASKQPILLASR